MTVWLEIPALEAWMSYIESKRYSEISTDRGEEMSVQLRYMGNVVGNFDSESDAHIMGRYYYGNGRYQLTLDTFAPETIKEKFLHNYLGHSAEREWESIVKAITESTSVNDFIGVVRFIRIYGMTSEDAMRIRELY